jgi:uncharacterized protein YggE
MWAMKTLQIVLAALLVLAIAAVVGIGRPEAAESAAEDPREGITVTGVGRVDTTPNEAQFSLGISSEATTASGALSANAAQMRRLIAALKAVGVAAKDIQTQDMSVGPDYSERGEPEGFVAGNTVSVRIRDLNRAGAILDAASRAGANNVSGPTLARSNRDGLEAKALEEAVADARKRAEALAAATGVGIGQVTAISESTQSIGPEPMYRASLDTVAKAPIEPGTQEVQATVSVTFAIE